MAYDNICKLLAEQAPGSFASWLLGRPLTEVDVLRTELSIEPIRADSVSFLTTREAILHIEFQTEYTSDPPLPLRMLDYFVRLHRLYRRPVAQVVILLKAPAQGTVIQEEFRTENTLHHYRAVRLWEEDPAPLLANPALLPLAALAQAESGEILLERVARQLSTIEGSEQRRNITAYTKILAGLKFDTELLDRIFQEGGMRESVVYQQILQEGRVEGRVEGRAEGGRQLLIRQLARKFGPLPDTLLQQIESIAEPARLEELADAVIDATSLDDFRTRL